MKNVALLLGVMAMPVAVLGQSRDTGRVMASVTVKGRAPVVERKRDRVIINVEASPTNTGSTVLEVLERSPGVTVDRNGGITLNGKQGVLVMIDDKPTYLTGDDLNNLLSSMNAAQVARIELIPNPPARYDAAGSAGIINIRTKKSGADGLNGSITGSYGQGVYPKTNNSLVLNYRKGAINAFLNYSINDVHYLTNLYAYRKYLDNNKDVLAVLQQPTYFTGTVVNNTAKTGLDYSPSAKTTVGFVLTGTDIHRSGVNNGYANWLDPVSGSVDSSVLTRSSPGNHFRNGSVNLHARQAIAKNVEIHGDLDYLHYQLEAKQDFDNQLLTAGGYDSVFRSSIPTTIDIWSGQLDGTAGLGGGVTLEAGLKLSSSHTDNAATYQNWTNQEWVVDDTRSNHFVYHEHIAAGYVSVEGKYGKFGYQAGLRYEHTGYTANEFGNSVQPDSMVSRRYGSLFPSGSFSFKLDSMQRLSLTVGRRIDRPVYQNLNPFLYIINKYTYESGNPYLLPQYSWNIELTHQYGELLTTGVSYSRISNYFSQIFLSDTTGTILFYTQGNVGSVYNLGVSVSLSLTPVRWWSLQLGGVFNHKQLRGFNGNDYTSMISQLNVNMSNQFSLGNGYVGELAGFYTTRARNDIQELLYPTGQLSMGMSKPVLKKKGTVRLSFRDMLYTGAMEGLTSFPDATEYFKIKRDSRVVFLSFTYRFGRTYKVVQHEEGASEEKERVQSG
ncbi:MAG TPA: outer membrane beta-barrel protein [Puia sp.]|jgi:outer membrane receptor protein involved in Fe transport|nr:outer membrane beta-barrel protein [Puia sp.]